MKNYYFLTLLLLCCSASISYAQVSVQDPHKPLISKATATWCNVCGGDAWDNFHDLIETHGEDAAFIAVHSDAESVFYSPTADSLATNFEDFFGVPSLYLGTEPVSFTLPWENAAEEYINEFRSQDRTTQSSLSFEINNNIITANASIQFITAEDDPHYYSILLVEDDVTGFQLNRGPRAIHSKILRTHITPNVINNLISEGPIVADEKFDFEVSSELEEKWKKEKLEAILVIWKKLGDQYQIVNTTNKEQAEVITSSKDLNLDLQSFVVTPNIVESTSQILVHSDKELQDIRLVILNSGGQIVKEIYNGNLPSGLHTFTLDQLSFSTAGLYFINLSSGNKTTSRRIFVKQ